MSRIALTLLLSSALGVAWPGQAAPYVVKLDARRCTAAPSRAAGLGPKWQALAGFIQECPVHGPDGRVSLWVIIMLIDRIDADPVLRRIVDLEIPDPLLLSRDGAWLGTLGEGFPFDPPGALRVTFRDWRDGLPRRIDLYEGGESALPPHPLDPMLWDAQTKGYRWQLKLP